MADRMEHSASGRAVFDLDRVPDAAQAERTERVELALVAAIARTALGDKQLGHQADASAASSAAVVSDSASPAPLAGALLSPSTLAIDRPRSSATSSGVRRPRSPSIVALT